MQSNRSVRSIRTSVALAAGFAGGIAFIVACERGGGEGERGGGGARRDAGLTRDAELARDARADARAPDGFGVQAGQDAEAGVRPGGETPCRRWQTLMLRTEWNVAYADGATELITTSGNTTGCGGDGLGAAATCRAQDAPEGWEPFAANVAGSGADRSYIWYRRCVD